MAREVSNKIFNLSSGGKHRWIFVLIILLTVGAFLISGGNYYNKAIRKYNLPLPEVKEIPFRLGLDLLGGTQLIYHADVSAISDSDKESAVNGTRDVIERRVNAFGVSEPNVQVNRTTSGEYRVLVELAGVKDVNEAIKMIGETPLLEFKEEGTGQKTLTDAENKQIADYNKQSETKAQDVLGKVISGGDFAALAKEFSQDTKTKDNGGDMGWITETQDPNIINIVKKLKPGQVAPDIVRDSTSLQIIKFEGSREKTNPFNDKEKDKEVKASHILICFKDAEGCQTDLTKEAALEKIKKLKSQATPMNFADLAKKNSNDSGSAPKGGDLGWFDRNMMVKEFSDVVFAQKIGTISDPVETKFGFHIIYKQAERNITEYHVSRIAFGLMTPQDLIGDQKNWKNTELTGKNLNRASVQFDPNTGQPTVSLEFDDEGAKMFADITERNVGKPVAIFLDSNIISSPNVNEKIPNGKAVISGNFNINEAKQLVARLNAGALPVPINLVNQNTIGASLGRDSLIASLRAGFIGFMLVVLFMIIFYRLPGVISSFSLFIYGMIVLSLFKLFNVTLTLSGMAGFIISIGMAVDANVLIFSRLREEIKRGKPLGAALEEGFSRAWPSIRDSNFFTIMTCLILITFSTSVVKGFAITLLIGVVISMFSAILITRNFLNLIPTGWLESKNWLIGSKKNK
jgi:protein-export membrane protein SecD